MQLRYQVGSRRAELRLSLVTMAESRHSFCGLAPSLRHGNATAMSESAMFRGCRAKVCEAPGSGLELFGCPYSACLSLVPS